MNHGLILVDKPTGMTSHDVVAKVRRWLGTKAIGHAGTLDPLATGLMVLLIGEATKISDYILTGDKGYRVKIRFGIETDSLDVTGQVTKTFSSWTHVPERVEQIMKSLMGSHVLPIPKFSATKINGETMLQKTLKNEEFEAPSKEMNFYDLNILENNSEFAICEFKCSKGSFVRAWVQNLGELLGYGATVEELNRFYSQPFQVSEAKSLENLLGMNPKELTNIIIPLQSCLLDWEAMTVSGKDEKLMQNGQVPNELAKRLIFQQKLSNSTKKTIGVRVFQGSNGLLSSIIEVQPFKNLKIKRVFRY